MKLLTLIFIAALVSGCHQSKPTWQPDMSDAEYCASIKAYYEAAFDLSAAELVSGASALTAMRRAQQAGCWKWVYETE